MIKNLIRKTIYKEFDKETQDILLQLTSKQYTIEIICAMFWAVILILPYIPIFIIIQTCEDINFDITTQIAISLLPIMLTAGLLILVHIFSYAMFGFSKLVAEKIYFLLCTTKGKAIRKSEFKIISKTDEKLYTFISKQMCQGYCYSVCFKICKILKKGSIEFLAIKKFLPKDYKVDKRKFAMHVIYVNNGWAFDTYSCRQYPIEKLHEIYKAKIYKSFSFDEISNKSFEEFKKEVKPELTKWSIENDCSMFLSE